MNTSILTVVLTGALLAGQNGTPTWHKSYTKAQEMSAAQKKPLAVVFGTGANGWAKVVREAAPTADVTKVLAEKYVCVYVDVSTPAGKTLAERFEMKGNVGIVLGDREATTQAFWHQGDLTSATLARYLQKYADPSVVVRSTERATTSRTSFYPNGEINLEGSTPFDTYCPSCNGGGRSRR